MPVTMEKLNLDALPVLEMYKFDTIAGIGFINNYFIIHWI